MKNQKHIITWFKNTFLESMKNICFEWRIEPFLYYNIEKFFQAYEISKQFDFNYITPFNYKQRSIFFHQSAPRKTKQHNICLFLSGF